MRRVLWKLPGAKAVERRIATTDEALRELIGCTYETRALWTEEGWGDTVILCAHQPTALALRLPAHIWIPTGTIAGPVIVINRNYKGQYYHLSDDDIDRWHARLLEFEHALADEYRHIALTPEQELARRREYSSWHAVEHDDDLTAVLKLQVEIERALRERILELMPFPERFGPSVRLELSQSVALAAAMDAIQVELVKLIETLGRVRNKFAHEPGYVATPQDVARLKKLSEAAGFEDTRWALDQTVLETVHMSEESRDLWMVFSRIISELDAEHQAERRREKAAENKP